MSSTSILGAGQSALKAAQTGMVTTGHNIANVNTPGYSRQTVVQSASAGQDIGVGFIGKGTEVTTIRRVFNEFLHSQVVSSTSTKGAIDGYYAQIKQIDNMFADPTSGVSASIQDFFDGVQDVGANPGSAAARQAMLSSAEAMASRIQSTGTRLEEIRQGVNGQITSSVNAINVYSQELSRLNDAIEKAQGTAGEGKPANDLLDQRDQVLLELSKEVKVSVVKQGNSYNVFLPSGHALVVGAQNFNLKTSVTAPDTSKIQVSYVSSSGSNVIPDSTLSGGRLGGLMEFRTNTLDAAQNALGRVAIGLAQTFNEQHQLGQDQTGKLGGAFFTYSSPDAMRGALNTGDANIAVQVTDGSKLTTSDYRLQRINGGVGGDFVLTKLSDGSKTTFPGFPVTIDGITLTPDDVTAIDNGDEFLIKPTINGASSFGVAISDTTKIAAGAPVRTSVGASNTGSAKISAGVVTSTTFIQSARDLTYDSVAGEITGISPAAGPIVVNGTSTYPAGATGIPFAPGDTLTIDGVPVTFPTGASGTFNIDASAPTTLTYSGSPLRLSGFPEYQDILVTRADGTKVPYPGASPAPLVQLASGDKISFGGVSFTITGTPADGDQFLVGPNTNGVGDNRNALLLGGLQTANALEGNMSYQSAFTSMVSQIGNKTRELEVSGKAEEKMLAAAVQAHESESGVNLDEEAANLMRYQQAYQAAAKVMQTASQLFELLLNLGQ